MLARIVEMDCVASVPMADGTEFSLLKKMNETIQSDLDPSLGSPQRGKRYRVTFEEIHGDVALTHHEQKE